MAISLNGEYIVVESVTSSSVTLRFHKDAEHRQRYKTGTETKYESTTQEIRSVPVDLSAMADSNVSIKDNNIISGYKALASLEEFSTGVEI